MIMKRSVGQSLVAACGITILVGSLVLNGGAPAGAAPTPNVLVVNPPSSPVPTAPQGTTPVEGTVGLARGTMVGVDPNRNTVTVGNLWTNPVFVRDVDRGTVVSARTFEVLGNGECFGERTLLTVPPDWAFILDHTSASFVMGAAGQVPIIAFTGGASNTLDFMAFQGGGRHFFANHQTAMSIGPGGELVVSWRREVDCSGVASSEVGYSGHFVPAP